jgi:signal peptidase II
MLKKLLSTLAGIGFLVAFDQLTKQWVLRVLKPHGPIPLIPGVLELSYVENRGAAFGILQNKQWFFIAITLLILALMLWIYPRIPDQGRFLPLRLIAVFIVSGALGNMIDRISRGYVVDFIYFKLIDFPVFNVADIYVTCSAFVLAFLLLFFYKEEEIDRILHKNKGESL